MINLTPADPQPIIATPLGDAVWLTSFITPRNPDIRLKYLELTRSLVSTEDRIIALWQYVANLPYKETISSRFSVNGKTVGQSDVWLYPSQIMKVRVSNCANRSFLLASLLKNELSSPGEVYCVFGNLRIDNVGAHAWCLLGDNILETTQPNLEKAFIPVSAATAYQGVLAFDETRVYTLSESVNIEAVLNSRFGICAIPFLGDYLCERCMALEEV